MSKPIFYDCITNEGNKSINIENIASIEHLNSKTIMTLDITKESGVNISFEVNYPYLDVMKHLADLKNS
ncbi:hypothetical protein N8480_01280 [Flavobacteriaceae bacterium]|nr:hypothetical protein [Flavobacteriaceae bacterium]